MFGIDLSKLNQFRNTTYTINAIKPTKFKNTDKFEKEKFNVNTFRDHTLSKLSLPI